MGEIFLENTDSIDSQKSIKLTCDALAYWNNLCYYEIYTCPKPCFINSDCFSEQFCDKDILSQVTDTTPLYFPENAGKCMASTPDWKTPVYKCANGVKKYVELAGPTNLNFCNEGEIKYLIGTTDQCLFEEPEACYKTDEEVIAETPRLEVGDACNTDASCISGHCDKTGFFSPEHVCQPVPWEEVIKVAATKDEISTMTTGDALKIACLGSEECKTSKEDYVAKCIPIQQLIDDGTLSFSKASFFDASQKLIRNVAGGATLGVVGGIALCIAAGSATAISWGVTAPVAAAICGTALTGGAIAGGALGYSVTSLTSKDPITAEIKKGDANTVGLCVATPEGGSGFINQFFGWAAFFDITGDKQKDGTDGVIIVGLAVILLFVLCGRRK
jgi:hypothetical protein